MCVNLVHPQLLLTLHRSLGHINAAAQLACILRQTSRLRCQAMGQTHSAISPLL